VEERCVGKPAFTLALLWDMTCWPASVKQLIDSLDSYFPRSNVSNIAVALSHGMACLHFSVDFSLYAKSTMVQLDSDMRKSGGRFIELLRIPEDKREAFKAEFLRPAREVPLTFNHFTDCARPIQEHLAKLARGAQQAPSVQPITRVASQPSQHSKRRATRFSCNLKVELQTDKGVVHEQAANISIGGIFVRTSQRPAVNSELGLKMQLPNGQLLQTTARVVHTLDKPDPGGLGLAFSRDDGQFMRMLERYFSPVQKK
jgi:uncharacterized protein (TIGR02266 family)